MTSSLNSFLSFCFCHQTKCCKAWKLPVCNSTLRMTSSLNSFLSFCFCHPTKCCKAWELPACRLTLRMTCSLKFFLSSYFCHPTICCKKKLEFLRLKRKREKGIKKGKFNNLKTMRRYRMYVQYCRWLPF